MDLVSVGRVIPRKLLFSIDNLYFPKPSASFSQALHFPALTRRSPFSLTSSLISYCEKRGGDVQPVLKQSSTREAKEGEEEEGEEEGIVDDYKEYGEEKEEEEEDYIEDFGDEIIMNEEEGEDFEDDFEEDDLEIYVGDGAGGGGISLAGTWWDQKAFSIAEEVSMSFDGDLKIYAFKTSTNCNISLRIEKLSSRYGSPSMTDIEAFSSAYRARLDEAELAGTIPQNISLEVSSPGMERVVRIPEDLERFKDKPMYVKYVADADATASPQEVDGIFRLVSFDLDLCHCTWGIADVRINREKAGKGRPLSKKQREWRLQTSFDSLRLVRVFSDC